MSIDAGEKLFRHIPGNARKSLFGSGEERKNTHFAATDDPVVFRRSRVLSRHIPRESSLRGDICARFKM